MDQCKFSSEGSVYGSREQNKDPKKPSVTIGNQVIKTADILAADMIGSRQSLNDRSYKRISHDPKIMDNNNGSSSSSNYISSMGRSSELSKSEYQLGASKSQRLDMSEMSINLTANQNILMNDSNKETNSDNQCSKRQLNFQFQQQVISDHPNYNFAPTKMEAKPLRSSNRKSLMMDGEKNHFKIDWRQLTYYQKPESFLSRLINGTTSKSVDKTNNNLKTKPDTQPKRILNSLDGCFKSGQLSAILGPSGAGKSTFLSTLFGSKQETAFGQTKVTWFTADGLPTKMEQRSIKIAFLPQHDHLLHHLTVFETLMFASKIKNADSRQVLKGETFHRQNVKRVAKMLKLTDCLDTRCGKLSGGQYKRVSIGQELLSEPDVIILDEPTSGLDAMTCLTTIKTLKSIAVRHPISIILTIHQPDHDVFNLFDHVYVIAQGGTAIYEGTPSNIVPTLASVGLHMPVAGYNPARFIVENAFIAEPEHGSEQQEEISRATSRLRSASLSPDSSFGESSHDSGHSEDDDDEEDDENDDMITKKQDVDGKSFLKRSLLSLTDAISGKEMASGVIVKQPPKKDKRPLLNIGIRTLDGMLITSKQLQQDQNKDNDNSAEIAQRLTLINRLNQIQRSRYSGDQRLDLSSPSDSFESDVMSQQLHTPFSSGRQSKVGDHQVQMEGNNSDVNDNLGHGHVIGVTNETQTNHNDEEHSPHFWTTESGSKNGSELDQAQISNSNRASSLTFINNNEVPQPLPNDTRKSNKKRLVGQSLPMIHDLEQHEVNMSTSNSSETEETEFVVCFEDPQSIEANQSKQPSTDKAILLDNDRTATSPTSSKGTKLKRKFDKRLSAKHNCSKQKNYPIWYHAMLLTHRTWLSIIRDPIFFGIQACMHTSIPILLAVIFGSVQDEGCPRIGSFDLVDFAYSASADYIIRDTVSSIRKSIGNVGIMFFEMFVLSFSINCITALVFPLDMFVLLKEYRNGWYTLGSYFFGRTLADLPVPIVLHSLGISILYFLTGQPHEWWRYGSILVVVITASLIAQSIGLTVGAILMRSSQSAVLTAAGIVAPFFALSGFIVRIHTLPILARIAASSSYLYHLLNSFIILRYGFGRCDCKEEDFEPNSSHQIPSNLQTMASMWIGTYSNEYPDAIQQVSQANNGTELTNALAISNRTNVDPNIDVVDKLMTAFKMANSYGHQIQTCDDVLPYAMLDFNLRDSDIYGCVAALVIMLLISRTMTFAAIYYKIRSFA